MAEHRERVDKRMSREAIRRVFIPLCLDLGARYLVRPYLGEYNDEEKTVAWGLGHKKHGDKRHRTHITFQGINYRDGEKHEGVTQSIEVDRHLVGQSSTTTASCKTTKQSRAKSCRLKRHSTSCVPSRPWT